MAKSKSAIRSKKWRADNPGEVKRKEKARYPEIKKRVYARRKLEGLGYAVEGKIVEHVKSLRKGGGNGIMNLRLVKKGSKQAFHQKKDGKYRRK